MGRCCGDGLLFVRRKYGHAGTLDIFFTQTVPLADYCLYRSVPAFPSQLPLKPLGHFCLLRAPPPLSRALALTLGTPSAGLGKGPGGGHPGF